MEAGGHELARLSEVGGKVLDITLLARDCDAFSVLGSLGCSALILRYIPLHCFTQDTILDAFSVSASLRGDEGAGLRVPQGAGCRVEGSGFLRVQSAGYRV